MSEPYQIVISVRAELVPVRHDGSLTGIPVFTDKKIVVSEILDKETGIQKLKEVVQNLKL